MTSVLLSMGEVILVRLTEKQDNSSEAILAVSDGRETIESPWRGSREMMRPYYREGTSRSNSLSPERQYRNDEGYSSCVWMGQGEKQEEGYGEGNKGMVSCVCKRDKQSRGPWRSSRAVARPYGCVYNNKK
jgi:hypothetical protein